MDIIITKLHFTNQVRALAVCKNWRDCKDHVTCSDTIPWVVHHEVVTKMYFSVLVKCELFNPYSQQVHKVQNSITMEGSYSILRPPVFSKQGWLHFYSNQYSPSEALLLYNPFTNDPHWVPLYSEAYGIKATIKVDPISCEFEIFMFYIREEGYLYMDTYKASGRTTETESVDKIREYESFCSVLYVKRIIYYIFYGGELYSYSLEDKPWKLLISKHPKSDLLHHGLRNYWLLEIKENLIMIYTERVEEVRKWIFKILRFDWSKMSWVVETGLKSCAIYISGDIEFSAPLKNLSGEKLEGCNVFYIGNDRTGVRCYSISEAMGGEIQCEEYSWISESESSEWSFIEPPYFWI